jgi:Tol biopolymer transport system component/DNA-binding winged helix-turn-helix (wHTH) protein
MSTVSERQHEVLKVPRRRTEENINGAISLEPNGRFRFGDFSFDVRERRLTQGNTEVALPPKAFDLLGIFVARPGQLLTKELLLRALWPDSFVEEGTLAVYISTLRKALGDAAATSRFIETVPKSGYRFIGSVSCELPEQTMETSTVPAPRHRSRWFRWIGVAAVVLVLAAAAVALGLRAFQNRQPLTRYALEDSRPFTSTAGVVLQPAFSADGNSLAYVWEPFDGGSSNIFVQGRSSTERVALTNGPGDSFAPAWSPDGRYLAFLHTAQDGDPVEIVLADAHKSSNRRTLAGLGRFVSTQSPRPSLDWSPDGNFLLSSDSTGATHSPSLVVVSAETGAKRFLTQAPEQAADGDARFSWDGLTVAFRRSLGSSMDDVYAVSAAGGAVRRLTSDIRRIRGLTWSSEGRSLIVASNRSTALTSLWRVFLDGRQPVELTTPVVHASAPVVARRVHRLAFVSEISDVNIWRAVTDGSAAPSDLISSTFLDSSPDISPDRRRVAFRSDRTGSNEIWMADADGRNPKQLTHFGGPLEGCPRWSPDGRAIAFDSRANGSADIYTLRVSDGALRRVTHEPSDEVVPSWSRDGRFLYYTSNRTGTQQIWKIPAAGGKAVQMTAGGGFAGMESADGRTLYYVRDMGMTSIWSKPVSGGTEIQVIPTIGPRMWGDWFVSRHYLTFLRRSSPSTETADIMQLDLATHVLRRIGSTLHAPESGNKGLSVSPDERWLLYSQRDVYQTNIMLAGGID